MQAINAAALRPAFLGVFTRTAALCAAVVVGSLVDWDDASPYLVVGGLLYLVGAFALTAVARAPQQALDRVEPSSPDAAGHWGRPTRNGRCGTTSGGPRVAAAALLTIALHVG